VNAYTDGIENNGLAGAFTSTRSSAASANSAASPYFNGWPAVSGAAIVATMVIDARTIK